MPRPPETIRCVECGHEYDLPALGEEMGCPECGGISWVSTRIASREPRGPGAPDATPAGPTASRGSRFP